MSANVVSLAEFRKKKRERLTKEHLFYMSKVQLLQELIRYYEEIKADPFNIELALWGEDLMDVISMRTLSRELHELLDEHEEAQNLRRAAPTND
ncbi:MAG TPA: hypothetical protein VJL87_06715 [Bdellovibrionota bacterium]|nr:hypothetical protein [Bdellovibrionota bacterium]